MRNFMGIDMSLLNNISDIGKGILITQLIFFSFVVSLGLYQVTATKRLRKSLAESLRLSRDTLGDGSGKAMLAVSCRTRYRNAAERIESVDALSIASSELARFPLIKLGKLRCTIYQSDELLNGSAGFLVTLGLVGTFAGLIQNLSGLSGLLLSGEGISDQTNLIQGFAMIFPAMGAAFITSLAGILLSSSLWLIGTFNGMAGLKDELIDLLCGYLEQVVQADCRCYSLVGESIERMQNYLDDYLSKFSTTVGIQIEQSIDQSIKRLVNALEAQIDETKLFVKAISGGCGELEKAGHVFSKATAQLERSDFASDFSEACTSFIDHTKLLAQSTENMRDASSNLSQQGVELSKQIEISCNVYEKLCGVLDESLNAVETSQHSAILTGDSLNNAVEAMEGMNKRGMTWLSMRAKTDSKLVELTEQLQVIVTTFSSVSAKISSTTYRDLEAMRKDMSELKNISSTLLEETRQNDSEMQIIKAGLNQMINAPTHLIS